MHGQYLQTAQVFSHGCQPIHDLFIADRLFGSGFVLSGLEGRGKQQQPCQ